MSRTIEQLVDQQIQKWMIEQRIADRASWPPPQAADEADEARRPIICISRECGALGAHIGRQVAYRMGYAFYAQELVDEIAKQAHVRRKVVESLDERCRTGLARFIDELVRIGRFTPSDYMRSLSEVVLTLGRHGGSVVVGRGAFLILDPSSTLRVRCRAPLDWRVAQMAKRRNMSAADARSMVLRIDAERVDFYRDNFKVDVSEPEHFDLVLDTSRGAAEKASVDAIIDAFEARFGAPKSEFRRRRPPAEVVARLG